MNAVRSRLKSLAWLALLAMFGVALGPSVSRTLSSVAVASERMHEHAMDMDMGSHAHMMEGGQAQPSEHAHGPADSSGLLDCCDLCAVAASACMVVVIFLPQWLAVLRAPPPRVERSSAKPDARELWSKAAPRGPPRIF